ncbi:MAG: response regulator [Elusimicrobia bacterium]|nr:response regulator [Candidatus Liberimonas magnetica]
MRILIVDDDAPVLDFLGMFFESLQHEAIKSNTYKDALKSLVKEQPDLVLLDIRMSEKDGLAIFKEMREIDRDVPIAMITAFKDAERIIEAFRLGAIDCLLKPFNIDYIVTSLLPRVRLRKR